MADEQQSHGRHVPSAPKLGVAGALVAILSIWWFAYRPRRKRGHDGGADATEA